MAYLAIMCNNLQKIIAMMIAKMAKKLLQFHQLNTAVLLA